MPKYVILTNWTDQGAHDAKNALERSDDAAEAFSGAGGTADSVYWTMGPYDAVTIADFPDDESASSAALEVARQGHARTTTMRAFVREDMERILD